MRLINVVEEDEVLLRQFADELRHGEPVRLPDVVQQAEGVVLDHHGVRVDGFLSFVHPTLNNIETWI